MARRANRRGKISTPPPPQRRTPEGGRLAPLSETDVTAIMDAGLHLLAEVGVSEAPAKMVAALTEKGATLSPAGRLCIPSDVVADALATLPRDIILHGRAPEHHLDLRGARVHVGTGGASPQIVDIETGGYREACLRDIHDAARLVEHLPHIHFFARPMVACDIKEARALDLNTAFACLSGTTKHVITSASDPEHVHDIAAMCFDIAGGRAAFEAAPFLSLNINHVVPPLRCAPDACAVMDAAIEAGLPVMVNTFGQMGASSPVTMAGCLAQTHAETLAGLVYAWAVNPAARVIYGPRPMITDLRSGGMAGGSGEQALLTAAAVQIARASGLPCSTIAGATDSKAADAQSGAEKALCVSMAAQAGCNLITQAAGTQAGLMATSLAAYVIDNDMLGAILQAAGPIEVSADTLATGTIARTVEGPGHFLGEADTYARMKSDFLYPDLADRQSPAGWSEAGAPELLETARARVRQILADAAPCTLPPDIAQRLRARFDIALPHI